MAHDGALWGRVVEQHAVRFALVCNSGRAINPVFYGGTCTHTKLCVCIERGKREISKLYNLNKIKTKRKEQHKARENPSFIYANQSTMLHIARATPSSSYRCAAKCRQRSAMLLIWRGGSYKTSSSLFYVYLLYRMHVYARTGGGKKKSDIHTRADTVDRSYKSRLLV